MASVLHACEAPVEALETELLALVARLRFGDAEALGRLHDLTLGRLYAVALRVLRDPLDAEEVVSDVLLQVWRQADSYCPERGAVLAWMQTLAWTRSVDRMRRLRRHRACEPLPPESPDPAYASDEAAPAAAMLDRLVNAHRVRTALAGLSPAQRRVLTLAFGEDLSHPEIARRTGWPLGTVKSHARRGLAALRAALDGGEGA